MKAVAAYQSQFGQLDKEFNAREVLLNSMFPEPADSPSDNSIFHPGVSIFELMHVRARQLGMLAQVKYAEAYTIKENVLIDDPLGLPNRSI